MRFIALVSGGKDSFYAALQAIQNGHTLVACLHLAAPINNNNEAKNDGNDEDEEIEESYMYQTAASEVVKVLVEECLGVPLIFYPRKGKSVQTGLVYDSESAPTAEAASTSTSPQNFNVKDTSPAIHDEVEDLFDALRIAQQQLVNIEAVTSGAILSTYQRVRIENVCDRLGLTSLSYLWRLLPQDELLPKMINDGIDAVLVKTACPPGLVPYKHLGKSLGSLWYSGHLMRLHERFQFHICGEGGEYESLVIDSPLHQKKLVLDKVEIIEANDDGVGELRILQCHAEDKDENDIPILSRDLHDPTTTTTTTTQEINVIDQSTTNDPQTSLQTNNSIDNKCSFTPILLPHVRELTGGLLHVSEIMAPTAAISEDPNLETDRCIKTEAELAVDEALSVFSILEHTLQSYNATARDVLFVHLYLSEMSHFASINKHYLGFFGSLLPPSRSCVSVGKRVLPGGRRVLLDCMIQIGSGEYMRPMRRQPNSTTNSENSYTVAARQTKTSKLRDVLHVQSISHWAPVCVGPYSQVNTLRSCIHFLAGQIGLVPATMQLRPQWQDQLEQCWINLASVLDALEGCSLNNIFGSLVYVSTDVYEREPKCLRTIEEISRKQVQCNGSIVPGKIDNIAKSSDELYGGYEDEGTWEEMRGVEGNNEDEDELGFCPALVVAIPQMPKGALIELETIASTAHVARYLQSSSGSHKMTNSGSRKPYESTKDDSPWDSGHTFPITPTSNTNQSIELSATVRSIGKRCGAIGLVTASCTELLSSITPTTIHAGCLMDDMLSCAELALSDARAGLSLDSTCLHIRLFYVATQKGPNGEFVHQNDGLELRAALQSAVASRMKGGIPAVSVVPVEAIGMIGWPDSSDYDQDLRDVGPIYAMQLLCLDPVHFETELWIHKDRQYV